MASVEYQRKKEKRENESKKSKSTKTEDFMGLNVTTEIRRRIELVQKNNPNLSVALDRLAVGGFRLVDCCHSRYMGKAKREGTYLSFSFREEIKTDEPVEFMIDLSQRMVIEVRSVMETIRDSNGQCIQDFSKIPQSEKEFEIRTGLDKYYNTGKYFYRMTRYVEIKVEHGETTNDFTKYDLERTAKLGVELLERSKE